MKYECEWIKHCNYQMINIEDIGKWDSYIFEWEPKKPKKENSQIPFSLTTVSPCQMNVK